MSEYVEGKKTQLDPNGIVQNYQGIYNTGRFNSENKQLTQLTF